MKALKPAELLGEFRKKSVRALGRLISLAENGDPTVCQFLSDLYPQMGKARVIGITGPPGAGKSTLTSAFVKFAREAKQSVGVIAVDPVSPFTGGALLGDRIRLMDHFNDPDVFIRSLSTRGKLGGLSLASREVVHLCDAFGLSPILVETVGVGQSEVEIRKLSDLTLVVLVPEWGDAIQTLKAGLLEIGDLFVVNKSDRPGADRLVNELKNMMQMAGRDESHVLTSTIQDEASVRALFASVQSLWDKSPDLVRERRRQSARETIAELLENLVAREARAWVEGHVRDEANPYRFLVDFMARHPPGTLFAK